MADVPTSRQRPPLSTRILAGLVWGIARCLGATARIRFENRDVMDGVVSSGRGAILVTWHGRTLIPANVLRHRGYWALISLSRDGELQNCIFRRFGFNTVRGSTGRGGIKAALQLARILREGGVLALTPDGPRGPTHKVQLGTIMLGQKSGAPVVPVGISARPRILVNSWDRYMVPLPFARVWWVVGEPLEVPEDADEEKRQALAEQLERAMNRVERRAEELAGYPYPEDWPV